MNLEVTSVSRRTELLQDAAASVFVITAEDIRRSGVTSLPEALRLAPNLQVAETSAYGYSISARGFRRNPKRQSPDPARTFKQRVLFFSLSPQS